jgi:transposase
MIADIVGPDEENIKNIRNNREFKRLLTAMHPVTPPAYVKAYVKRGKTDAADAEAICEAVTRPSMRFVSVKTADQQAVLMLHKTRELLVRQRTMLINALRSHLAEFGIIAAQGVAGFAKLLVILRESKDHLPAVAFQALAGLTVQLSSAESEIEKLEARIMEWHRRDSTSRRLVTIPGIGPITASAISAACRMHPFSVQAVNSQHGSASPLERTAAAAKTGSRGSPSRATAI